MVQQENREKLFVLKPKLDEVQSRIGEYELVVNDLEKKFQTYLELVQETNEKVRFKLNFVYCFAVYLLFH